MIDVSNKNGKQTKTKHFASYKEVAHIFIETLDEKTKENVAPTLLVFADYLDTRNTIGGSDLTLLAMQKSREIEKEILNGLIDHIGVDQAQKIMLPIVQKYRHGKK